MEQSRRGFLGVAGMTALLAAVPLATSCSSSASDLDLAGNITDIFNQLPGSKGLKIWAPAANGKPEFTAQINPDIALFCASSFKAFVLAEFLRQMEAGGAGVHSLLTVDDTFWSLGAPVLTVLPPTATQLGDVIGVTGQIDVETALDAMIGRSDNTATDMMLNLVGADKVRQFISSIGLTNSRIPNSTRQFFAYLANSPIWQSVTWAQLFELFTRDNPYVNPIINATQTMAVSPHDFISFYSRGLQGEFFKKPETLDTFRAVLGLADALPQTMPLGVSGFAKGGSIDAAHEHALSLAGGMYIPSGLQGRWVYYSMIINWNDPVNGTAQIQQPFVTACKQIFTLLRDSFGAR